MMNSFNHLTESEKMTLPKSKSPVTASSPALKKTAAAAPVETATAAKKGAPVKRASRIKVAEKAVKNEKRVRASFSMPETQFVALAELKARCLRLGINAKKGEVLAAGIQVLRNLPETSFEASILPYVKADHPVKNGKMRQK
jgi:hypothetical protein